MNRLAVLTAALVLMACESHERIEEAKNQIALSEGDWRFTMDIRGDILPFTGHFSNVKQTSATLTLRNAEEEITISDVALRNDSVFVTMPFFKTEMRMRVESPGMLSGIWIKPDRENYQLPITAEYGNSFRFTTTESTKTISPRYQARFEIGTDEEYPAVLLVDNDHGRLTGTILTETGDYRFLQGNILNGSVYLSTFDGGHAFFFKAEIEGDSLVNGVFKSGSSYETSWEAIADSTYQLQSPGSITQLVRDDKFDLYLPDQDGNIASWSNLGLEGKVVVIDIMGTWCPNCMDASKALKELAAPYSEDELTVIAVLFEYIDDLAFAKKAFREYSERLDIPNEFLFGGRASKEVASAKFPMLNSVSSFPTLIFVGKDREVAEIYTGFYGPGTGDHYDRFMADKEKLLAGMVKD